MGNAFYDAERHVEAERAFRRALAIVEDGLLRRARASLEMDIALSMTRQGRGIEALPLARTAFADIEQANGSTASSKLAWAHAALAEVELATGDRVHARRSISRAVEMFDEAPTKKPILIVSALGLFARAHGETTKPALAARARAEALIASSHEDLRPNLRRQLEDQ